VLDEPAFLDHVPVHFVLHARDRLDAARDVRRPRRDDPLRGDRDRLALKNRNGSPSSRHADRRPGAQRDLRAMFAPVAPSGFAQPMITSSMRGSIFARSSAAATTWPPSVAPCVMLNAPRHDFAERRAGGRYDYGFGHASLLRSCFMY
jgi:hypothetical protein